MSWFLTIRNFKLLEPYERKLSRTVLRGESSRKGTDLPDKEDVPYQPEVFDNGDTLRQLLARSRYLLFKSPDKWTKSQRIRAEILFKQFDDIKQVYYYSLQLGKIFSANYDKDVARAKLALWYNKIEEYGYDTFTTVANSIQNHYERILNFFVNRSTNAAAEAFNAKIKAFRAAFRGGG